MATLPARSALDKDLQAIVELQDNPGVDTLGRRGVAFVHPKHSHIAVNTCFEASPQGAFVNEIKGNLVGYLNAIRLPSRVALAPHNWTAISTSGTGAAHNPAGKWLYVCRMLLTAGAGHQSLGPELSPLLLSLKNLAMKAGLEGVAIALPFPGKRDRSGTTEFQRQTLTEGAIGPSASINIALYAGFDHEIALPNYIGITEHFALMVWRNPALD